MKKNNISKDRKKKRLKITTIDDFKVLLSKGEYQDIDFEDNLSIKNILNHFDIDYSLWKMINKALSKEDTTYRADNIENFIDYIRQIEVFKDLHSRLSEKIKTINTLNIDRVEYERIKTTPEDVSHIIDIIETTKRKVTKKINQKDEYILYDIERELNKDYIYAKDIELLKKMIFTSNKNYHQNYNQYTKVNTLKIEISKDINYDYIPAKLGSVEYYHHIKNNIPRMKRLIKNIDKYMIADKDNPNTFNINQTSALQDTMNIAVGIYNDLEFRAVSGTNYVKEFCTTLDEKNSAFISTKVNKLGKLGVGYNRINDSEKKILEEINIQIEKGLLKDAGNLVLYSKWQPCPSCYYVINQFSKKYSNINIEINYIKEYGECS